MLNPHPADPGRSLPGSGAGVQSARFAVKGCRSFDFRVKIETDPAACPLLARPSTGVPEPILRDSPILEWIRVGYTRRALWTHYRDR